MPWLAPLLLSIIAIAMAVMIWSHTAKIRLLFLFVMAGAFLAGFIIAEVRSAKQAAPVIPSGANSWLVTGLVTKIDSQSEHRSRYLIKVKRIEGLQPQETPVFVRVGAPTGPASIGSMVRFQANIEPPSQASVPGGFSYARSAWFLRLGGTGFTFGHLAVIAPPSASGWQVGLNRFRNDLSQLIRFKIPGQSGAIAAALITGDRSAIDPDITMAFRGAGLSHLLAISGLHMSIVGGMAFWLSSLILAAIPIIGAQIDARKPAAIVGLLASFSYLLVSGAAAPTQRAFIMLALIFLAVALGRKALSIRTISIAAFVIALLSPEYVVTAGFQLSFAASLALIAVYQKIGPWFAEQQQKSNSNRFFIKVFKRTGLVLLGIALTSLVAGLATAPFASWHFHKIAVYSLIGNLAAMPVFTVLVMPFLFLGLLVLPLGLEGPFWQIAGFGLSLVFKLSAMTADLPGAVVAIRQATHMTLLLEAIGLLLICLGGKWLKFVAIIPISIALILHLFVPSPNLWIGQKGGAIIESKGSGSTLFIFGKPNLFALRQFVDTSGIGNIQQKPIQNSKQANCDQYGCTYILDRNLLALQTTVNDLITSCNLADIVISLSPPLPEQELPCANSIIFSYQQDAGSVFYFNEGTWSIEKPSNNRAWDRARTEYNYNR